MIYFHMASNIRKKTVKKEKEEENELFPELPQEKSESDEEDTLQPKKTGKYKNAMLFEYLSNILMEKSAKKYQYHVDDVEFNSSFTGYMITKYLSMHSKPEVRNVIFVNQIALDRMSGRNLYWFLLNTIPRQSSSFIKYIKPREVKQGKK